MPDYPFTYAAAPPHPVAPGGTRVRLFRRRARPGEEAPREGPGEEEPSGWRALLTAAVAELNEAFAKGAAPFSCVLEEDRRGLSLRILHLSEDGSPVAPQGPVEEIEEFLDPAELPRWLARLRSHLGILVDDRV